MKTKLTTTLILLGLSVNAWATSYRSKTEKIETPKYKAEFQYIELLPNAAPAYNEINEQIYEGTVINGGCGEFAKEPHEMEYSANVSMSVVALNQLYVGFRVNFDSFCGGAHPNFGTVYLTFDAKQGKLLNLRKEFSLDYESDLSFEEFARRQRLLAELMVDRMDQAEQNECFTGSREEKVDQLMDFYPNIAGLAAHKKIILSIAPPHAGMACYFDLRVSYQDVQHLLNPDSYLHQWLR